MVAASRLQSLIDSRDYSREIAELRFQLGKIGEAVQVLLSRRRCGRDHRAIEEVEHHPEALDAGMGSFDDADDDAFDPTEFIDEDDEF